MTFAVRLADGDITGEAKAEALAEKGGEGEFIEARITRRFSGEDARGGALHIGGHGDSTLSRRSRQGGGKGAGGSEKAICVRS